MHAHGGHAGHSFVRIYSSCVVCDNLSLRWLLPPKVWGRLNVYSVNVPIATFRENPERDSGWSERERHRRLTACLHVSFHRTRSRTGLSHLSLHGVCGKCQGDRMHLTSSGAGVVGTFSQTCPWYTHRSHSTRRAPTRHSPGRQGRGKHVALRVTNSANLATPARWFPRNLLIAEP